VLVEEIPHKGGRTFGFRVEHAGTAIAYLSDHAPLSVGPVRTGSVSAIRPRYGWRTTWTC